ncbi:hypothetical protein BV898_08551 [Hypsibius exemplaris]|uniref:Beta-lactamase-related domain-containing protein n=1 Tax=Hypsibius exemplaris TaxID=2072580 RepID=A0A1W0WQ18_HYPEX|nr:hypothetical protein BV898_08551 [Hypsibius exemplaris]
MKNYERAKESWNDFKNLQQVRFAIYFNTATCSAELPASSKSFKAAAFSITLIRFCRPSANTMRNLALIYGLFLLIWTDGCLSVLARLLTSTAELDDLLDRAQRCNNIPALGFAVTALNQDGKTAFSKDLIYARTYGPKPVGPVPPSAATPMSNRTMYCVGSITKHVTAILVLHLLELLQSRGHNYTVKSLLPDILPSLDFAGSTLRDVTIEDILSHRTGLAVFVFGSPILRTVLCREPSQHLPRRPGRHGSPSSRVHRNREAYLYNNFVFNVAGLVAETLGEKFINATVPWEMLVKEFFLRPLGISASAGFADYLEVNRVARPFMSVNGKHRPVDHKIMQLITPAGAAGSLCLSPEAMAVWMQFVLNRGRFAGVQVVSVKAVEESWQPRILQVVQGNGGRGADAMRGTEGLISSVRRAYALGWGTGTYRGFDYVGHGGGFYSYLSLLTVFPEVNISIFTSTSGPATANLKSVMRRIHLNIFDRLMGYRSTHHKFCEPPAVLVETPRGAERQLNQEEYTGNYSHPTFGNLTVSSKKGKLYMEIGRFGNASIHCWRSISSCELRFHGILWWISGSDAFYTDRDTNRTIIFQLCRNHVRNVTLPLFSTDVPPVFHLIEPEGSPPPPPECVSSVHPAEDDRRFELHQHRRHCYGSQCLKLPDISSTAVKIDWFFSVISFLILSVVFHHCHGQWW